MSTRPYCLVDVFHDGPLSGNPLAVVHDAEGLASDTMQRIANWLNLSEATFLLPPTHPDADYRVRIFTGSSELPFAGHPTLGTCHAWLSAGGVPKRDGVVIQECGVGLIPVRRDGDALAFAAPPLLRSGAADDDTLRAICAFLDIPRAAIVDAQWVDNGPGWVAVMLASAGAVLALKPRADRGGRLKLGVIGPHQPGGAAAYEVRAFFGDDGGGMTEDPVTGSLNASIAQWLYASGRQIGPYVAAQGTALGRNGRVFLSRDDAGQVWVAGRTATLFRGESWV
jgi:PhzF family phenazine biosynthesis protein